MGTGPPHRARRLWTSNARLKRWHGPGNRFPAGFGMHGGGGLETETQLGKGLWRLGLLQRQLEMCDVFERPQRRD